MGQTKKNPILWWNNKGKIKNKHTLNFQNQRSVEIKSLKSKNQKDFLK